MRSAAAGRNEGSNASAAFSRALIYGNPLILEIRQRGGGMDGFRDVAGTALIGVLLVAVAIVLAIETKSLLLGESADVDTSCPEYQDGKSAETRTNVLLGVSQGNAWGWTSGGVLGLFAGISGQAHWQTWLLFANGGDYSTPGAPEPSTPL